MGEHSGGGGQTVLHIDAPADGQGSGCDALPADAGAWLRITYGGADERPATPAEEGPAHVGRLLVGDQQDAIKEPDFSNPVVVDTVTDPTDLNSLGTAIGRYLGQWEDDDLAVCFDSVTALLRHVDEQSAVQFLHLLVQRLEKVEAVVHFHLDPTAHDEATIETVTELVDTVEGPEPTRNAGDQSSTAKPTTPANEHEPMEHITDGGVTTDGAAGTADRSRPDDVDEATDQDVADAYADL